MIIKKYKANTNVSINVVLPSKKNLHISFIPLSDGSSVFQTDNEDIQRAIESHYNFGRLFRLVGTSGVKAPAKKTPAKAASPAPAPEDTKPAPAPEDTKPAPAPEDTKPAETEVHTGEETVQEETTETAEIETAAEEAAPEESGEVEESPEESVEGEVAEESGNTAAGDDNGLRKVTVSDIAAAKDYLADTIGISRTSMRSTKSILQKAAENGIEFVGL